MSTVQEQASLHEKAVQAVAKDEVNLPKRKRKGRGKAKNSRVQSNTMIFDLMAPEVAEHVRAMDPDLRCVQVIESTVVVVWNHPNTDDNPWPGQQPKPRRRRVMGTPPEDTITVSVIEDDQ